MPYDSNGNFSLVPSYFVQDGDDVLPSQHNPPLEDIGSGLSQVILRNGVAPLTGNLNANGNKVINLAAPTNPNDAVRLTDLNQRSRFHAHKNGTNQTGGDVTVTFTTEVFDVGGVFDTANSRFTPEDGAVYVVYGQIGVTITGLGERRTRCRLVRNGDTAVALGEAFSDGSGYSQTPNFTAIVVGNGTDYYTVTADTADNTYPVQGATEKTYFMAWRIA